MAYTIFTLIIVNLVLLFGFYKLIYYCFCIPYCQWNAQNNNTIPSKEATILSITTIKKGKHPYLEAQIVFENFSDQLIHAVIRFKDKLPHLNRFQKDGKMTILIDSHKKPKNPVLPTSEEYGVSFIVILFYSLLTLGYISGHYYIMGEAVLRINESPFYYETTFANSFNGTMILSCILALILLLSLFGKNGRFAAKNALLKDWELLYYGLSAMATVQKTKNSVFSNKRDSCVNFTYVFKNQMGTIFQGSDCLVIDTSETTAIAGKETIEIMYLPYEPTCSKIASNLENLHMVPYFQYSLMFFFFIFSGIMLLQFCLGLS